MDRLIYLDNAATSFPKPEPVYTFMDQFFRRCGVNPGRSGYDRCMEAGLLVEDTRRQLMAFFGGRDPNRLVFSLNSTDALNLAIFGLLEAGDHAVTTTLEHNSVLRPLYHLAGRGVDVDHVPFDGRGFVDPDEVARAFRPNTKLVVVNHASNVIGTVQPIADIGRRCRERGVTCLIDASQTAGKVPIDVEAMCVDVVAFTGHKSLMGPTGIGGLYVGEHVDIRLTRAGGTGVRSAVRTHLEEYPWRLEYGTPNLLGIAGLHAGVEWVNGRGMTPIHEGEMALMAQLRDGLAAIDGVTLYCQDDLTNHIGVLAFNVRGYEAADVGTLLDVDYEVACRTGLQCAPRLHEQLGTADLHGAVRLSVGPFNTADHIATVVEAVREIAAARAGRPVRA
ncbi:MAG: aminotransferase class V-fold PLP-dependent enzyme [Acidobacteria bacterium]|nr:aminotransferase class V-fold PLP-dependent enzyme [Acidobacteriota bacterium]